MSAAPKFAKPLLAVTMGDPAGIGAEVARHFASRGPLLLADRDLDGARKVAAELGGDVEALGCDITDPAQVDAVVARVRALGALLITAGLSGAMATVERILEVNLRGTARVLDAVESIRSRDRWQCASRRSGVTASPRPRS